MYSKRWIKFTPGYLGVILVKNPAWRWWKFWREPRLIKKEQKVVAKFNKRGRVVNVKLTIKGSNAN